MKNELDERNKYDPISNLAIFEIIKKSLWQIDEVSVDQDVFKEMKRHAIAVLSASCLSSLALSPELEREWKGYIIQQLAYNTQCIYEQNILPITIPYTVLKGTSAAQYYPHPEYRTMGDIDIMPKREDYQAVCNELLEAGWVETTSKSDEERGRHRSFMKQRIIVEVHAFFASMSDPNKAKAFDDLIVNNITPEHILPDFINGLVLIEHINQHLHSGIGLRQIIDWMMFVDKCMPDENWPEFRELAQNTGLERLAIVTTRMCEMYLGLPHREWCAKADTELCMQLMEYVLSCGNFGNKKTSDESISENAFTYVSTPKMLIRLLQRQGLKNWNAAKDHRILRPFAWIYQGFRYISKGFGRDQAILKLKDEYTTARKRNRMFDALGVKNTRKGLVKYINGEYIKE